MLQGHGDNAYLYNRKIVADFSSNVYFKGPSKELILHLQNNISKIANYPEVAAESLNKQIAEKLNLSAKNILVTNGATEAFYLLALLFRKSASDIFTPSFAEYADACNLHNHVINYFCNSKLTVYFKSISKLIWICNPNNPDGKILSAESIGQIINNNKNSYIIIDEAYIDFTLRKVSVIDKVKHYKNLIIVRSLTKKYAIPGLRLGYIVAPEYVIAELMKIKQPWSVNIMAINAAEFLLNQNNTFFNIEELIRLSRLFQNKISEIKGLEPIVSETSYFLIKTKNKASQITDILAKKYGLLVRNASNFRGLNDFYIRVATQCENDNNKLVNILKQLHE